MAKSAKRIGQARNLASIMTKLTSVQIQTLMNCLNDKSFSEVIESFYNLLFNENIIHRTRSKKRNTLKNVLQPNKEVIKNLFRKDKQLSAKRKILNQLGGGGGDVLKTVFDILEPILSIAEFI